MRMHCGRADARRVAHLSDGIVNAAQEIGKRRIVPPGRPDLVAADDDRVVAMRFVEFRKRGVFSRRNPDVSVKKPLRLSQTAHSREGAAAEDKVTEGRLQCPEKVLQAPDSRGPDDGNRREFPIRECVSDHFHIIATLFQERLHCKSLQKPTIIGVPPPSHYANFHTILRPPGPPFIRLIFLSSFVSSRTRSFVLAH